MHIVYIDTLLSFRLSNFDQTFFSDNLLIKGSFLAICRSNVHFWQVVEKAFFVSFLASFWSFFSGISLIKSSFLTIFWSNVFPDNSLIKRSFLTICWSNVLSDSDVTLELPFTLSHPKPPEETPPPTPVPQQNAPTEEAAGTILREGRVEQTLTV